MFLDEINSAAQATQAAAYQLVLDRRLGDYVLPEGWSVIAAGNRASDAAIVNQMSTALRNRLAHINYDVSVDDWCLWALTNNIATEIIAFIRFRPTLLNEFEKRSESKEERARIQKIKDSQAFATPRSWEFLSRIVTQGVAADAEFELFSGLVGEGCAAEFIGYLKYYRSLPNFEQIFLNPMKTPVPDQPATLYALATGLAARIDEGNIERGLQYCSRMPIEFQALTMKDVVTRSPKLAMTRDFQAWAVKNKDVLM